MTTNNLEFYVSLCDKIDAGELDKHLSEIEKQIVARKGLLKEKVKIEDFCIGDRVIVNERCGTKYVRGETGTVSGIRRTKIVINFDNPKGRFARVGSGGEVLSAEVVIPFELVDKL